MSKLCSEAKIPCGGMRHVPDDYIFSFIHYFNRTFEYLGVRLFHQHFECSLGAHRAKSSSVQALLCTHSRCQSLGIPMMPFLGICSQVSQTLLQWFPFILRVMEDVHQTLEGHGMVRGLARNVQAYNPPNSGDVGWTLPLAGAAAPHVCTALAGTRPPEPAYFPRRERARPGEGRPRTALHLACASGRSSVVALLIQWKCDLDARDKESKTALIKAVQCRKEACVSILLKRGADPNLADDCQNTALHYAVLAEDTSVAAELLRYKANIEAINKYNFTPFLVAVRENKEEMVEFLIENGANVHAVDMRQRSALMLAAHHDSPDIVKLLLQKHVNACSLDFQGWSAERYACCNGFKQ
ncbi:uncharacterized protein LOC141578873 [Camelus bactrianus]|uniref:Uncharacterized protein LOC141578873 n=1 Tax=Camelus bactrianus TaxID=9837 RepID=A0AC58R2A4_CAMBA